MHQPTTYTTDILYICGVCVGGSWCIHPTPCYPPMHQWCVALFLTETPIVAEAFSAGARLTAPNYETTTFPTWGASVHRTRVSPLPVSGFFIRRKKVNETTEQPCETPIAPRPWTTERREYVYVNKKGYKEKKTAWFLVDANGNDVWRTYSNMQHVCDCVNSTAEVYAENERELTYP